MKLSNYDIVNRGKTYTFVYTVPLLNPIVNSWALEAELRRSLVELLTVQKLRIFGNIKITFIALRTATVEEYNSWIKPVLDTYLWGETEFIGASTGEVGYFPAVEEVTESIKTASNYIIILAILVIGILILTR